MTDLLVYVFMSCLVFFLLLRKKLVVVCCKYFGLCAFLKNVFYLFMPDLRKCS